MRGLNQKTCESKLKPNFPRILKLKQETLNTHSLARFCFVEMNSFN